MAKLLFSRRANIGACLIRAVSWSAWSHVQVVDGDDLWGASFGSGVGLEKFDHRMAVISHAALVTIPAPNDTAVIDFAKSQKGKPYDHLGAFGLSLHRSWQDPVAWWCSEYAAACLLAGGVKLFRDGVMDRVTPQHLFMLNYSMETLK